MHIKTFLDLGYLFRQRRLVQTEDDSLGVMPQAPVCYDSKIWFSRINVCSSSAGLGNLVRQELGPGWGLEQ